MIFKTTQDKSKYSIELRILDKTKYFGCKCITILRLGINYPVIENKNDPGYSILDICLYTRPLFFIFRITPWILLRIN